MPDPEDSKTPPPGDPPPSTPPADPPETDWKAEAEKYKAINRKIESDNKKNADRLKEFEDANKSELEKVSEAQKAAEGRAAAAERELARTRVALRKGLTEAHARRLVGDTEEELEADADDLIASFKLEDEDDNKNLSRRPQERLRPGSTPNKEPEPDVKSIVDKVMAKSW